MSGILSGTPAGKGLERSQQSDVPMFRHIIGMPIEEKLTLFGKVMELRKEKHWGRRRIAKDLGLSSHTVDTWLRGRKPWSLTPEKWNEFVYLYNQGWSINRISRHSGTSYGIVQRLVKSRVKIRPRKKIPDLTPSPELAYIMGAVAGDGTVSDHEVGIRVKDKDFAEKFGKCASKIMHTPYKVSEIRGFFGVSIQAANFANWYRTTTLDEKKSIIEEFPAEFLRGFFDAEGSLAGYPRKNYNSWITHIVLTNSNLSLLFYVSDILRRHFQISVSIRKRSAERTVEIQGREVRFSKPVYELLISGCRNTLKFKPVSFTIERKKKKFEELCRICEG